MTDGQELPPGITAAGRVAGESAPYRIRFSDDGEQLLVPRVSGFLDIWFWRRNEVQQIELAKDGHCYDARLLPDGCLVATTSNNGAVVYDPRQHKVTAHYQGHQKMVVGLAVTDEGYAITGGWDDTAQCWEVRTGKKRWSVHHGGDVEAVLAIGSGRVLTSADDSNGIVTMRSVHDGKILRTFTSGGNVLSLAFDERNGRLAAGTREGRVDVWNVHSGELEVTLENHLSYVQDLWFADNGKLLLTMSADGTLKFWRCDDWQVISRISHRMDAAYAGFAVHRLDNLIAVPSRSSDGYVVELYAFDPDILLSGVDERGGAVARYTTAKIALVGDTGAGKTTLGWRLVFDEFQPQESTHGQQFWTLDRCRQVRENGIECDVILWDFAGQPKYRMVHALFLHDIDLALILFDASDMEEDFKAVDYWIRQLGGSEARLPAAVLVGARADVGAPSVTAEQLREYARRQGISGGYVLTSAKTGEGIGSLLELINDQIRQVQLPLTVSDPIFRHTKDEILRLKATGFALPISIPDLRTKLGHDNATDLPSAAEFQTVLKLLEAHGYLTLLRRSNGEVVVLLVPDLLIDLISSLVNLASRNPKGLGAIEESRLLNLGYQLPELQDLPRPDQLLLLDSAVLRFLSRNLCFREALGTETLLIFPELITEGRDLLGGGSPIDDCSYLIEGSIEGVYATLVVLLGYTNMFRRSAQARQHAEFDTGPDQVCGFRQVRKEGGELEIVVYHAPDTRPATVVAFRGLFEEFLSRKDVRFTRIPSASCASCHTVQEQATVVRRTRAGRNFVNCEECGDRIPLSSVVVGDSPTRTQAVLASTAIANTRTAYEAGIVTVKAAARDSGIQAPSCFISYAWGNAKHEEWVAGLARDLIEAGIGVVFDRSDNAWIGSSIPRFIERIERVDWVVVVGAPLYRAKYDNRLAGTGSVAAAEMDLINVRLTGTEEMKASVLPCLLAGEVTDALPPLMHRRVHADFRDPSRYLPQVLDVILTMYRLPFSNPVIAAVRQELGGDVDPRGR